MIQLFQRHSDPDYSDYIWKGGKSYVNLNEKTDSGVLRFGPQVAPYSLYNALLLTSGVVHCVGNGVPFGG